MNVSHISRSLVLALALLPIAACTHPADTATSGVASGLDKASAEIRAASDRIREEIATGDMDLSSDDKAAPDAVITAKGELVIDGRSVSTNATQAALLLEYRRQLEQIAQAGAEIGLKGAGVAMAAMGEALKGAFSGANEADIERAVEAQASGLKDDAAKLCERMPAFIATQDMLSAALPEFAPYANATADDVADCWSDTKGASVTSK
ncbi:MAG: hypothetical protein ABIO84_03435 [Lysobacter sp.]